MVFLISLGISLLFILLFDKLLRAHPAPFYGGAAAIALAVALTAWAGIDFDTMIWPAFARGGLAGALFVLVMFTGAFPNGSAPIKKLMPIRGPLSILASILALGHNAAYGKIYFTRLFTDPASLPVNQWLAAVCSLLMLAIMLPLFVTSFRKVRRKMSPKTWKKLQRWAYLFYGLLGCHILLLTVPMAAKSGAYRLTVFVYSTIFLGYLFCRVGKAWAKKHKTALGRRQATAVVFCGVVSGIAVLSMGGAPIEAAAASGYRDGVYTGSAMGMNAPIEVSVTIAGGEIADIVIDSHRDDEEYFRDALYVIDDILAAGSTQVDTVTGATYSSGGILDAVDNALEKAGA